MDELEKAARISRLTAFAQTNSVSPHRDKEGKNADESLDLGKRCLADEDFEGAIIHFQRALQQGGSDYEDAASALAGAYETADQDSAALEQYLAILQAGTDAEAAKAVSDIERREGHLQQSIEPLRSALETDPNQPYLHYKIADTLRQFGHRTEAAHAITEAIRLAPEDRFYRWWMGELLYNLGRFAEAAQATSAAIELGEQEAGVWRTLGLAYWGAGMEADGIAAMRKAVERTDAGGECAILMAEMLSNAEQEAEAHTYITDQLDTYDVENAKQAAKPLTSRGLLKTQWI